MHAGDASHCVTFKTSPVLVCSVAGLDRKAEDPRQSHPTLDLKDLLTSSYTWTLDESKWNAGSYIQPG